LLYRGTELKYSILNHLVLYRTCIHMRLNPRQIDANQQAVSELAGIDATVRLFGSRTDDNARGGDIDSELAGKDTRVRLLD